MIYFGMLAILSVAIKSSPLIVHIYLGEEAMAGSKSKNKSIFQKKGHEVTMVVK